ncbi:MAG: DUF2780 domain-containing protein [Hyphomicrobiales bacterium]
MQELIERVSGTIGIDSATAEKAIGIIFRLIRRHGDDGLVRELFAKLPGAETLVDEPGQQKSGLSGMLSGALSALGGASATVFSGLKSVGLDREQSKTLGHEVLDYVKEQAGETLTKNVIGSIDGLSDLV